jgi:murein DD-endopeptidase MepM/ murein hydrolase activator NlpD
VTGATRRYLSRSSRLSWRRRSLFRRAERSSSGGPSDSRPGRRPPICAPMCRIQCSTVGCIALCLAWCLLCCACTSERRAQADDPCPSGWPTEKDASHLISRFGDPRGRRSHEGIDIAAARGTRVRATAPGLVIVAGRGHGAYGRLVVIDHGDGWETRYAHLASIEVRKADRVHRGAVIGQVGRSGNATSSHLHYEVRRDGTALDPQPFLDR